MRQINAKTLHDWISDGQELALLDAREDGEFGRRITRSGRFRSAWRTVRPGPTRYCRVSLSGSA